MLKAGTYDIEAEGEWSASATGAMRGREGNGGDKNGCLRVRIRPDMKHQSIGKGGRITLTADEVVQFKMIEGDDTTLSNNRGSMNIKITPVK